MKISAIKPQEKRKDRYSIFVDGKYAFSLSEIALLNSRLIPGQELSIAELQSYKKLSQEDKAYNNTLRYVSLRMRSEWEIREYLRRKQVEEEMTEQIVAKLRQLNFINDEVFAHSWIENRRLLKSMSRRRLVQELKQKRIDEDLIERVMQKDQTDEKQMLKEVIDKKKKQTKYQEDDLKLMQYLSRQGFTYDDIKSAMRENQ